MRQIIPPDNIMWSILGEQAGDLEDCRWSSYVLRKRSDDGWLIYHTLTCELLFATDQELNDDASLPILVKHHFMAPSNVDEYALAKKAKRMRQLVFRAEARKKLDAPIERFWVLTTTNCNAHCFYCHEKGVPLQTMTEETASDVVSYIEKHSCGQPVQLLWYGGEPLVNETVIDQISLGLSEKGISYTCKMISNGYGFSEQTATKAANLWHLKRIQITLDGMESTYNRVKNYDETKDSTSPFLKVLDNISHLLNQEIDVVVRMNLDRHNIDELGELSDFLVKKFGENARFSAYTAPLFETCLGAVNERTEEQRKLVYAKHAELGEMLNQAGVLKKAPLARTIESEMRCLAVSPARVIFPDGSLAFCHDYMDDVLSGSIYGPEPSVEEREAYAVCLPEMDACKTCVRYPQCVRLEKCFNNSCNEETIAEWILATEQKMKWEYKKAPKRA